MRVLKSGPYGAAKCLGFKPRHFAAWYSNLMPKTETLNPAQEKAARHKDGPLLIIAGAGAGKTKTIAHRILNLIQSGVAPEQILAITFTNKAAREMGERVRRLLLDERGLKDLVGEKPFVSTFHSLGIHILRENAKVIGRTRHFSIFDEEDTLSAIREAVRAEGLDPKQFEPNRLRNVISRGKGELITAQKYAAAARDYFPQIAARIWRRYEQILSREGGLDFDDLILKTVELFEKDRAVLAHYQSRWPYLHVDEYQDTNQAQYELTRLLSAGSQNICVVGDSDQNIYGWRGANLRNILNFEKDYPAATVILLEENYRSTQTILSAANNVIRKNKIRKEKNLFTKNAAGEKIGLYAAYDESDEAGFVAEKSAEIMRSGVPTEDIAVLYRANFQSRALEEAFLAAGLPYQVLGTRFFERKEVKDTLSYLRAALSEGGEGGFSDWKRILNVPPRGIGPATMVKIFAGRERELSPALQVKLADFKKTLAAIRAAVETKSVSAAVKFTVKKSGLEETLLSGGDEGKERFENLMELVTLATRYDQWPGEEGMRKLLDDAALSSDQDSLDHGPKKSGVKLMTVHAAKGLEFRQVFVTGLEADLFPHHRVNSGNISREDAEEERRLFYVALTRAKEKLWLTFTETRTIFGSRQMNSPSEFLGDIEPAFLEFVARENPIHRVIHLD